MSIKNGLLVLQKLSKASSFRQYLPLLSFPRNIHIDSPLLTEVNLAKKFGHGLKPDKIGIQILSRREKHHEALTGGDGGESLPIYKSIGKPLRLTIIFIIFFGLAFWAPMILFVYMMVR